MYLHQDGCGWLRFPKKPDEVLDDESLVEAGVVLNSMTGWWLTYPSEKFESMGRLSHI